ncbi:MAG: hypothetical protein VXX80_00145 [Bacteroidota bacterium]|nr:hypothetical protein [Bacteroidota bacterium]
MKNSMLTLALATSMIFASCVDRKTNDNGEVELEEKNQQVTPEDMFQTSGQEGETSPEDLAEINSAKKVINDYFDALERGETNEAYEALSQSNSERTTPSEFAEKHANVETATVSYTTDPQVVKGANGTDVKLPFRYTILTKDGNTMSYNGSAMIVKSSEEDADYKIQGMTMSREES